MSGETLPAGRLGKTVAEMSPARSGVLLAGAGIMAIVAGGIRMSAT